MRLVASVPYVDERDVRYTNVYILPRAHLRKWRAVLQARNSVSKGGQSGTNMYAYAQYLYGVPIVATIDLDAPDKHLVQRYLPEEEGEVLNPQRSRWLLGNTVRIELDPGDKFWDASGPDRPPPENTFSLFAQNLRRRRRLEDGSSAGGGDQGKGWAKGSPGPGGDESSEEDRKGGKGRAARVGKAGKEGKEGKAGKAGKARGAGEKGGGKKGSKEKGK